MDYKESHEWYNVWKDKLSFITHYQV